ncbi:hypothetical protein [Nocardioides euryhalodurans]|uniref:Uncharacterized protein n=1 Tax=Nocardioides euryhalodurans TaxID=2518370 RepID=A0A4P7GMN7_9ACTN|nr:hypothetical protein [Nocardioides euryhalodurans]QBR93283.1 hypothetical protein EXE57_14185 [Nocardioides euryhalodurans]
MGTTIDWGTIPDWVAAVGTVLAVTFSAAIAFKEMRTRKVAEDKLHAQSLRSMRSDGEAFVAWLEVVPSGSDTEPPKVLMHMTNTGERPVYDITAQPISLMTRHTGQKIIALVVGPAADLVEDITNDLKVLANWNDIDPESLKSPQGLFGVRSTYRDSAGRCWERSVAGLVFEVPAENTQAGFWREKDKADFSHVPWSRPSGWKPTVPDPDGSATSRPG